MFVGIDPGFAGAIVGVTKDRDVVLTEKMPVIKGNRLEYDIVALYRLFCALDERYDVKVTLEKAVVVPVSGRLSVFSTGFGSGAIQGVLTALEIPYIVVAPKTWQKEVLQTPSDTKRASIAFSKKLYPTLELRPGKRMTDHDGIADAACLATFCYRKF